MRVIAGMLASRRLRAVPGSATRPTSDRVKEALFSILGDVGELCVLDLYAGTGSLGIEALSRGAARAVFVERSPAARKIVELNVHDLALGPRCVVVGSAASAARPRLVAYAPFDLVLCDPPYADVGEALRVVDGLADLLAEGARVVVEHARNDAPQSERIALVERRVYGDTALSFFEVSGGASPGPG